MCHGLTDGAAALRQTRILIEKWRRMVSSFLLLLLLLLLLVTEIITSHARHGAAGIGMSRDEFPPEFVFGAGTSAYQIEGAAREDGRKPSIWDTFAHAGKNMDKSNADVTADQYHKYKEDVKLMHEMGLEAYRFSISWSRLIPDGRGDVNPKGLEYYNSLINELIRYGIEPHVTLDHFDHPQALEDMYGGLLNTQFIEDFTAYADVCFKEYGDRVKRWITFNEPNIQTVAGYDIGVFPPGRCCPYCANPALNCTRASTSSEVYTTAHNLLLAHAAAVQLYRQKYQAEQKGLLGITFLAMWYEPLTNSRDDVQATRRVLDFELGWFMDPIVSGDYPATMRKIIGPRLPSFSKMESRRLKGSFDFIGLNHYTVAYVSDSSDQLPDRSSGEYASDMSVKVSYLLPPQQLANEVLLGLKITITPPAPWALEKLVEYFKYRYGNPAIFIHENGYGTLDLDLPNSLAASNDTERIHYLQLYMTSLLSSIRNGSNIQGYFVWSFTDCFELLMGYKGSYGLIGVDFQSKERSRHLRRSATWYSNFLLGRRPQNIYWSSQ